MRKLRVLFLLFFTSAFSYNAFAVKSGDLVGSLSEFTNQAGAKLKSIVGLTNVKKFEVTAYEDTSNGMMKFDFKPSLVDQKIKLGDVVVFNVINKGVLKHEFGIDDVVGTEMHKKDMMSSSFSPDYKSPPNTFMIESKQSKTIFWHFKTKSKIIFSCTLPGHFEMGMKNEIIVD